MSRRNTIIYLGSITLLLAAIIAWYSVAFLNRKNEASQFDGNRALADVQAQVDFGPRIPGSQGHAAMQAWLRSALESAGWVVEIQSSEQGGHPIENIIAKRSDDAPQILLGAHYDTRIFADNDPEPGMRNQPVPGANDGASGVAVLLGIARSLPSNTVPVWLVFFDSEDNGRIDNWDWILGSRAFVARNPVRPKVMVNVDMVGDSNLNIYLEHNSDLTFRSEIWRVANNLGYSDKFISTVKYTMLDDHTPFLEAGIPAVEIIDFDYPYWHTTQDTPDKVSSQSLEAVGSTLQQWILQQNHQAK